WGALLAWYLMSSLGLGFGWTLLVSALFCGAMGLLLDWVAFRPLRARMSGHLPPLVSSLAVSIILVNIAEKLFGTRVVRYPESVLALNKSVGIGDAHVSLLHVLLM